MANPRKFSEKIALHNTRQAEETAAFDKIMKEVLAVTSKDDNASPSQQSKSGTGGAAGGCSGGMGGGGYRTGGRTRSPCGPMRRDRKLDTSPYSSTHYLSPPADTGWRRTNSDSALHQSAMQGMGMDRNDGTNRGSWNMLPMMNGPDRNHDGRPRSSCDLPRVPGIHIYPSAPIPNQIPIGNNTGSLPDLTNMDFTSPIHTPLDQDQDGSPYSSSPINTSPSTLSPTNIPQGVRPQGKFHFTPVSQPLNHLSVPVNSRYHHRNMRHSVDSKTILQDGVEYTQLGSITGIYQQQCPPTSPSPTLQQTSGYCSPRPSPQSSPSLGGRHSAPCSPGAPSPLSNDYQIFNQHQAAQFQQHFEQLSMVDSPPVSNSTLSYVDSSVTSPQMTQATHPRNISDVTNLGNLDLTSADSATYNYSTSPSTHLVYPSTSPGLQTVATTPNTPSSLPEIILTDFSGDDTTRQEIEQQLDNELFGSAEDVLKEELRPLDFNDMQILNIEDLGSIGIPESVEREFRLERS